MFKVISNCWALFLGMGLIMLGNGLQGSLLGVRASMEGFDVSITGLVMSGYFLGLVFGPTIIPKIIARVGHVRSFGALASLASTSILVHVVLVDPWIWWAMRFVTGFASPGIFIVAVSWLNDAAENETRGQLLSVYMLVTFGSMAGGQFMLNIADPSGYELFLLISVFISFAVVPILVSVSKAPDFEITESVSVRQLYKISPLGVFGILVSGISMGAIFGMGAVYASSIGLSVREISFFMGSVVMGGVILQYPAGRLSDIIGRRPVIVGICVAGAAVSFFASAYTFGGWPQYIVIGLVGGLSMPLYSLCIAHTNDYLDPRQMVAASGTLVMATAIGASIGSPLTAFAMDYIGPPAFYQTIGASLALIAVFALWRSTQREAVAREDCGDFVVMAPTPISTTLNPELELEEIEAAANLDAGAVQASFAELAEDLSSPGGHG